MEKSKFLELQYQTLRNEIEQANDRAFKLMLGGSTGVPAVLFAAKTDGLEMITPGLPFLVLIIAFLFFAQNLTIKRCGCYIREHIEPCVEEVVGWETWLADHKKTRSYDRTIIYIFYLLSVFYYLISVFMAVNTLAKNSFLGWFIIGYIFIGFFTMLYIIMKTPICTKSIV